MNSKEYESELMEKLDAHFKDPYSTQSELRDLLDQLYIIRRETAIPRIYNIRRSLWSEPVNNWALGEWGVNP